MESLSGICDGNIILPSRGPVGLFLRLPVKERGLSADAEGKAEDQRSLFSEQAEAFCCTADREHHTAVYTRISCGSNSGTNGDADVNGVPRAQTILALHSRRSF